MSRLEKQLSAALTALKSSGWLFMSELNAVGQSKFIVQSGVTTTHCFAIVSGTAAKCGKKFAFSALWGDNPPHTHHLARDRQEFEESTWLVTLRHYAWQ
jgi:hypothetical protein